MPDLSNYVQMDEKTTKNANTMNSHTINIKYMLWKLYYKAVYANNSSTVVYGGDILSYHFFEALNDIFKA